MLIPINERTLLGTSDQTTKSKHNAPADVIVRHIRAYKRHHFVMMWFTANSTSATYSFDLDYCTDRDVLYVKFIMGTRKSCWVGPVPYILQAPWLQYILIREDYGIQIITFGHLIILLNIWNPMAGSKLSEICFCINYHHVCRVLFTSCCCCRTAFNRIHIIPI